MTPTDTRLLEQLASSTCIVSYIVCRLHRAIQSVPTENNLVTVCEVSYRVQTITFSVSREIKQSAVIDPGNILQYIVSKVFPGCPHAIALFCLIFVSCLFLGHRSATSFSNDLSLLSNNCALPPLCADPVHLYKMSFHARAPVFYQVLSFSRDQRITSTQTFV